MLLKIYPDNPNAREVKLVVECLRDGGIIICPTDTIYGIGCDIFKQKAVERIAQIKGIKPEKANFSFICYDLSHIADFTRPFGNTTYKLMKKALPGPFTFILNGNSNVPKLFQSKKRTVGIRIPNNKIALEIVKELGNPIMSSSIYDENDIIENTTDPELIYEKFGNVVDIVIDGGFGEHIPSTIVDCTMEDFNILRQGKGILEDYL